MKKMYPTADTIVFLRGDYRRQLGNKAVHFPFKTESSNGDWEYGSIIPIKKGSIEIKNDKLIVYLENGNFSEQAIDETVFPKSLISLKQVTSENMSLDSIFIRTKFNYETNKDYLDDIYSQYPVYYTQYQIGIDVEENWSKKWSVEYSTYFENQSMLINVLPIYETSSLYQRFGQSRLIGGLNNYEPGIKSLYFEFQREQKPEWNSEANTYQGLDGDYKHKEDISKINKDFQKYLENFTDYLRYKNQGNLKKASSSLENADKSLNIFMKNYFNLKYYY
jgi:soluble cytochrome b562